MACGHLNRFEGMDSGRFAMTKSIIYDRRVLDWLVTYILHYCGTGRCAYASFMDARGDAAEAHGSTGIQGVAREPGRHEFSEAVSAFIFVLGDAPGSARSLAKLFTYDGECCDDNGVAIDITASGILE